MASRSLRLHLSRSLFRRLQPLCPSPPRCPRLPGRSRSRPRPRLLLSRSAGRACRAPVATLPVPAALGTAAAALPLLGTTDPAATGH
ncbi:hypothetical protein DV515_00018182, partial [Chloebia gouldiae]